MATADGATNNGCSGVNDNDGFYFGASANGDLGNNGAGVSPELYHASLLLPSLRFLQALLTTLPRNRRLVKQALSFVHKHHKTVGYIRKGRGGGGGQRLSSVKAKSSRDDSLGTVR